MKKIAERIAGLFRSKQVLEREEFGRLKKLPKEERERELGRLLHEICVDSAASFVKDELGRSDSPFRDLPKADFFHEILVLNFWILEKVFAGKRKEILDEMYRVYSSSFTWGWESSHKEMVESIREKHRVYSENWDDHTGHQDLFGESVSRVLFQDSVKIPVAQSSYWIISYTDSMMKRCGKVRQSLRELSAKSPAS